MKKALKIIKKSLIVLLILIALVSVTSQVLLNMQFRQSDKKIKEHFNNSPLQPEITYIKKDERPIRSIHIFSQDTLPLLVFVHGAPGSATDFINYLNDSTLQMNFNMIGYDRPGYGYSDYGNSMTSLKEQAEALFAVMNGHLKSKTYLVSHSYGGPIALRFTMEYPDLVDANILLAPAIDPKHEKIFAIAYLGKHPPTRWLTPTAMKVATDEKLSHVEELEKMLPLYDKIESKVIHIHGTKDSLVPFENLAFAEEKIDSKHFEKIVIQDEDHFLPWTQFNLVKKEILSLIDQESKAL